MSAICGLVRLDGPPVEPDALETMRRPMEYWGPDGGGSWREGGAAFGQLVALRTPEDEHEAGPLRLASGTVVTPAARLDNREELCRRLELPGPDRPRTSDGRLVALAYERWGEQAFPRLLGDWSLAAWHPRERRLVLARDHYGQTALYYHSSGDSLAFASSLKGLLALPQVPRRLNELQLARSLVLNVADGAATMYDGVRRLPAAHALSFDASGVRTREYWSLMDVPEVRLASDGEYVERLLDLLGAAVRARLRSRGPLAATLSAGLDSSAVTALAARELDGAPLTAYTARPAYPEVAAELPDALVDEWPGAHLVAARYENVEHVPVDARDVTPLQAIEHSLAAHDEPEHAIPNLPWVHGLLDAARENGARVLLTGQYGNGSVSWPGDARRVVSALAAGEPRLAAQRLRHLSRASRYGWGGALWHGLVVPTRSRLAADRMRREPARRPEWRSSVIAPHFAARIGLRDAMRASGWDPEFTRASPRERRLAYLLPGKLPTGAWWHQRSAAQGVEMRDPTADVRVLEFCIGTPDEQFARDGHDRWLIRRALAGLVPPEVAWNTRRGAQGADIAYRLRADARAVSAAVERVAASGAAREYLDVNALRRSWAGVAAGGSDGVRQVAGALAFGLFLIGLADDRRL
ncbi:MAG TPA: asparagine synthase-related protein [Thermoleophilaceae bacterium]|jgi:asparagine synthase (glutamine-hydrolysing)